jgi:di/tricarboxylate transporter
MLLVGRFLLPTRQGAEEEGQRFRLEDYLTELTILPDSPLKERTIDEVQEDAHRPLRVVGLVRGGARRRRPGGDTRLEVGDVLIVRTSPEALVAIRGEPGVELHPVAQYEADGKGGERDEKDLGERFVQAVVAPEAEIAGRTISGIDFRRRYGAIVLGLWRRDGWLDQELAQTRLRPGDVLVLQGDDEALGRVAADSSFLMLVPFHSEARQRRKALVAAAIMAVTVALAALNLLSIEVAAVAGAVAMVLTGCLTAPQAYRAIDTRIYVFIAGAIPLGTAMKATGASDVVAAWLQAVVGGWSQTLVLAAVFTVVAVITQLMSDSATTALFAPVAVALAQGLGQAPEPYVVTVAMAAVASFLTPIGHHGNLLVYTPGGYRFRDFVVVGAPLTALVGVIVVLLAPIVFGGGE